MSTTVTLTRDSNQALGIGEFALQFLASGSPDPGVLHRTNRFHADAALCGLSALALQANAPTLLRREALDYPDPHGALVFGDSTRVKPEKMVVANSSAMREWDSNGTNFGFNPGLGNVAGEFGHNDFYPVPLAAAQVGGLDGATALKGMVLVDEIRGRLAEVFSLKTFKIDHVVHGAIASAATYGAMLGATAEQIESAIGMFVAHYIPWRAIRAGKQLSDSKGASAALSTEAAILCMKRAMAGFIGPKDIFRNPESMFRQFVKTDGTSPFDLTLSLSGDDFAVMGMHFKLGLYEHQSAGALQGALDLVATNPHLAQPNAIDRIVIKAYEPAFGIIGDPAKRDPHTRQSADHSMVYIVATLLRKAIDANVNGPADDLWKAIMLSPYDYAADAIHHPATRALMDRIAFEHGGEEYDARYPDGIPTSVVIWDRDGNEFDSGMVMYPAGHARNTTADLDAILRHKFEMLGAIAFPDGTEVAPMIDQLLALPSLSAAEVLRFGELPIAARASVD